MCRRHKEQKLPENKVFTSLVIYVVRIYSFVNQTYSKQKKQKLLFQNDKKKATVLNYCFLLWFHLTFGQVIFKMLHAKKKKKKKLSKTIQKTTKNRGSSSRIQINANICIIYLIHSPKSNISIFFYSNVLFFYEREKRMKK